jgi:hypothetical protein
MLWYCDTVMVVKRAGTERSLFLVGVPRLVPGMFLGHARISQPNNNYHII